MSVVPLHIVTEQDVRDFLASQPDRQQIEARTGDELRLICALYRGDATSMSREACVRFVELVVQSEVSPTTYQTTHPGDAGLPGRLSRAGSATSLASNWEPAASPPRVPPPNPSGVYASPKYPTIPTNVVARGAGGSYPDDRVPPRGPPGMSDPFRLGSAGVRHSTPVGPPPKLDPSLQLQWRKMEMEERERERQDRERERQFERERIQHERERLTHEKEQRQLELEFEREEKERQRQHEDLERQRQLEERERATVRVGTCQTGSSEAQR